MTATPFDRPAPESLPEFAPRDVYESAWREYRRLGIVEGHYTPVDHEALTEQEIFEK